MTFLDELQWRGLLYQTAGADIDTALGTPMRVGYCGFDPTSDSLTIGNFMPIKMLMHWQRAGHKPIVVMGGGTGLIGDPSGKDAERTLKTREQVCAHVDEQRKIFEQLLDFDESKPNAAVIVNNLDWLDGVGYIDMLRGVGKHFSVNMMVQKDSVKDRLHNRDQGISYTEFSYMILQAYDFLHLNRAHDCTAQIAGSDQYGNIVAGMDLIRRVRGEDAGPTFGVTCPMVTRSDGKKIGKTEDGAVWLTASHTSPYAFYQYWINVPDDDIERFLKWYTFRTEEEIASVMDDHRAAPHTRSAQRALAEDMTALVHGADEVARVEAASGALFGRTSVTELDADLLRDVFADVPHSEHDVSLLGGDGASLVDLLPETSLAKSKREAREFLGNGAVFVNGEKAEADRVLTSEDLLHGTTVLLRRGKKNWHATKWAG
jgi:tyrosyl-tRNA synthetase